MQKYNHAYFNWLNTFFVVLFSKKKVEFKGTNINICLK